MDIVRYELWKFLPVRDFLPLFSICPEIAQDDSTWSYLMQRDFQREGSREDYKVRWKIKKWKENITRDPEESVWQLVDLAKEGLNIKFPFGLPIWEQLKGMFQKRLFHLITSLTEEENDQLDNNYWELKERLEGAGNKYVNLMILGGRGFKLSKRRVRMLQIFFFFLYWSEHFQGPGDSMQDWDYDVDAILRWKMRLDPKWDKTNFPYLADRYLVEKVIPLANIITQPFDGLDTFTTLDESEIKSLKKIFGPTEDDPVLRNLK